MPTRTDPASLARRLARTKLGRRAVEALRGPRPELDSEAQIDEWLTPYFDRELTAIQDELAGAGVEGYRRFRDLDDDLWALLLSRSYSAYPGILEFLPDTPEPALQQMWNGTSGAALAGQSVCFYRALKQVQARFGSGELAGTRVLDFGCGWGRLTRFLARDVEPGLLYGCDPVETILAVCRDTGVPAQLARSEFLPERIPFAEKFGLVFSFSVFTHISEAAHLASLGAIHDALEPGGLFVATIRPPSYLRLHELMRPALEELGPDPARALSEPRYVFVPHETEGHPQYDGDEMANRMAYGEAVITMPYVRERWTEMFELLDVRLMTGDMYQVVVTLRKPR